MRLLFLLLSVHGSTVSQAWTWSELWNKLVDNGTLIAMRLGKASGMEEWGSEGGGVGGLKCWVMWRVGSAEWEHSLSEAWRWARWSVVTKQDDGGPLCARLCARPGISAEPKCYANSKIGLSDEIIWNGPPRLCSPWFCRTTHAR